MKKHLIHLFLGMLSCFAFMQCNTQNTPVHEADSESSIELKKVWSTDKVLLKPESVIYNPADGYMYVANINGEDAGLDSNGFISQLTTEGKIKKLHWSTGLDSPKGMGIYNNKLYVADVNKVSIIDLISGKVDTTIAVPHSIFLNDISISDEGDVYISDSHNTKIYLLKESKVTTWYDEPTFQLPNGLLVQGNQLIVADMDAGKLFSMDRATKELKEVAKGLPKCDGINAIGNEYLVSCWPGEIYITNNSEAIKLIDTKEERINAADAWYIKEKQLLLVPTSLW